ncbi:TPA: glycosyltransferase family 8 protein [Streptococcus suis]|nr:glycosyltransferase family 8 protein [Streptococcus suis]
MNIVYASDNNFADILRVSVLSLLRNTEGTQKIHIWVIDNEISEIKKEELREQVAEFPNAALTFVQLTTQIFNTNINLDRGSVSSYDRLLVGSLLPMEVERVIYLDSDVMIQGSLTDLYYMNMNDKVLAAVTDVFNGTYKKLLNIPTESSMFNPGVMLIDLVKWRTLHIEECLLKRLEYFEGNPLQGDLGLLNSLLYDCYYELNPKYNMMTAFYDFTYKELIHFKKPSQYYSDSSLEQAKKEVVVRHFTTSISSIRPWYRQSSVSGVEEWAEYMKELGIQKSPYNEKKSRRTVRTLLQTPLRKVVLHVLSFVQLHLRPMVINYQRKR